MLKNGIMSCLLGSSAEGMNLRPIRFFESRDEVTSRWSLTHCGVSKIM